MSVTITAGSEPLLVTEKNHWNDLANGAREAVDREMTLLPGSAPKSYVVHSGHSITVKAITQGAAGARMAELSVKSRAADPSWSPVGARRGHEAELEKQASAVMGEPLVQVDPPRSPFVFSLGQYVVLEFSEEAGEVIGRAEYACNRPTYLVRYKAGDGRQVEQWWAESALRG